MTHNLKIFLNACIFCLSAFTARAQCDSVFKIPYPQRYAAIRAIIYSETDSAGGFHRADLLMKQAEQRQNEQDLLAIEQAFLTLQLAWKTDLPHIEEKGLALIKRAEKINCRPIITFVYYTLGNYNYRKQNFVRGFEYYEQYLKECDDYFNANGTPFPEINYNKYTIAWANYKFYDYGKAIRYSKELLNGKLSLWEGLLINDLVGMSYVKIQQYDSAVIYFQKLLELAPKYPDPNGAIAWKGIATGNIGLAYYMQKKYDVAIPYLLQGEELSTKTNIMDNIAAFSVYLANIYLAQKNPDAAQKYLDIARSAAHKSNDLQNYCDVYTTLSDFYRQKGNTALTLQYLDSSLKFKDSFAVIKNVNQKYNAEINVAEERRNLREKLIEKEKQKQILIRNGSITIILMILVYVFLFFNRKLLKQKLRREQLLLEKQKAETELLNAQRLLTEFTRNITEKNELIESLREKENDQVSNDVLTQLQQSTLVTDDQWEDFRALFEKAHPGYLYRIKEKLPGLTPAETRFMALVKLKLSNKEMSAMLGNSPDAIRQYRSRIRKKFDIPEQSSVDELAETI